MREVALLKNEATLVERNGYLSVGYFREIDERLIHGEFADGGRIAVMLLGKRRNLEYKQYTHNMLSKSLNE